MADQMEAVERVSNEQGSEYTNLALLTDGLRAEREQGITIDVAYRYFATPKRTFIIADTPGHIQYTRNMVTGASTADLAIVLVDARKGLVEQSRRHAFLTSLLGVNHLVVAINKMDMVDWDEATYNRIREEFEVFAARLNVQDVLVIPISALHGDNVVSHSPNSPWYDGPSLLHHLENVHVSGDRNLVDVRFPVQYVIRPHDNRHHDYRGYAGTVAGGAMRVGDEIMVLPSGLKSKISAIDGPERSGRDRLSADGGDDPARGQPRHLPRRHAVPPEQRADVHPGHRGHGVLDDRPAVASRGQAGHQAHHPHRPRGRARPALPPRRQHPAPRDRRPSHSA